MTFFVLAGLIVLAVLLVSSLRTIFGSSGGQRPGNTTEQAAHERAAEQLFEASLEQQLDSINTRLRAREALAEYRNVR
ncbi:hypothetical protein [Dietzia sp. MNB45]|uniref:hypothetical protein n=1 Tax=Dietzia sp. MNB45 TaxID=3238800 RepID=UPI003F8076F4